MITINTNTTAMTAQSNLLSTQSNLNASMEKLSTGLRINSAADDAAGMQISNRMETQINGLGVAQRNANDAISMAQTAEGAMTEITDMLNRMRDLSLQAANDTNNADDRTAMGAEVTELVAEIDSIVQKTDFAGIDLLKGDGAGAAKAFTFQVGADSGETIEIEIGQMDTATLFTAALDLSDQAKAQTSIGILDKALTTVDTQRSSLGAKQNRLESIVDNLSNIETNMAASQSRIKDVDFAKETTNMTSQQMMMQAGASVLSQAKSMPQYAAQLLG